MPTFDGYELIHAECNRRIRELEAENARLTTELKESDYWRTRWSDEAMAHGARSQELWKEKARLRRALCVKRIRELEAELAQCNAQHPMYVKRIAELEAENARLRKALKDIALHYDVDYYAGEKAREALNEKS